MRPKTGGFCVPCMVSNFNMHLVSHLCEARQHHQSLWGQGACACHAAREVFWECGEALQSMSAFQGLGYRVQPAEQSHALQTCPSPAAESKTWPHSQEISWRIFRPAPPQRIRVLAVIAVLQLVEPAGRSEDIPPRTMA